MVNNMGGEEMKRGHLPPASSNKTRRLGSSDKRAASAQPAVPGGAMNMKGVKEEMRKHASTSDDNIVFEFCGGTDFVPNFAQIENISLLGRSAMPGEAEDEKDRSTGEDKADGG